MVSISSSVRPRPSPGDWDDGDDDVHGSAERIRQSIDPLMIDSMLVFFKKQKWLNIFFAVSAS